VPEAVQIRRGTADDIAAASIVWELAHLERMKRVPEAARKERAEATLRDRLGVSSARFFVVEAGGRIVGVLLANDARENDGAGDVIPGVMHVSYVAVHPAHWRRGIASRLLDNVINDARARRYARLQLWVITSNIAARRLYERFGFVFTGREKTDDFGERIAHYALALEAQGIVAPSEALTDATPT